MSKYGKHTSRLLQQKRKMSTSRNTSRTCKWILSRSKTSTYLFDPLLLRLSDGFSSLFQTHSNLVAFAFGKKNITTLSSSSAGAGVMEKGGGGILSMVNAASTIGGGVRDPYGEDHPITPWITFVASGYTLVRDPRHNKGLAFTEKERDAHYLQGLLPPVCITQELQEKNFRNNIRQYEAPIQRYMAMMDLQERNERHLYKLLMDNVEELLPIVYTPTITS